MKKRQTPMKEIMQELKPIEKISIELERRGGEIKSFLIYNFV